MSTTHVQSSDLSRNPKMVYDKAEENPVVITRRDGEELVLMSAAVDQARRKLVEIAAHLIAATTRTDGPLAVRLAESYPWILALPKDEQAECATALVEAARASFATHQPHLVMREMTAWHETAIAHAAGLTAPKPDLAESPKPVERP